MSVSFPFFSRWFRRESVPRILIVASGKSGTTALYYTLLKSCPKPEPRGVFEPQTLDAFRRAAAVPGAMVCKALPNNWAELPTSEDVAGFNRIIHLRRDPRDLLISRILYLAWNSPLVNDPALEADWMALLQRKERDPRSVPVGELIRQMVRWRRITEPDWRAAHLARTQVVLDLAERMPGIFTFRYEDMVAGRFEHLESFLGFAVLRDVEVAPEVDRVVRTKGSGGWRHWFTPEDLEWVRADFGPLVRRMGYDDGDWALAPSPEIRPEHASGYVRRILAQKRALQTPSSPPNKV